MQQTAKLPLFTFTLLFFTVLAFSVDLSSRKAITTVDAAPNPAPSATVDYRRSDLAGKVQVIGSTWEWSFTEATPKLVTLPADLRTAGINGVIVRFHCQGSTQYYDASTLNDPYVSTPSESNKGIAAIGAHQMYELGCRTLDDLSASFPGYKLGDISLPGEIGKRMPPMGITDASSRVSVVPVKQDLPPSTILNWVQVTFQGQSFYENTRTPATNITVCLSFNTKAELANCSQNSNLKEWDQVNKRTGTYLTTVDWNTVVTEQKAGRKAFLTAVDLTTNEKFPISVFKPSFSPQTGITLTNGGPSNTYDLSIPKPKPAARGTLTLVVIHDGGTDTAGNSAARRVKDFEPWLKSIAPFNQLRNQVKIIPIQSSQSVMRCTAPSTNERMSCDDRAVLKLDSTKQADAVLLVTTQAVGVPNGGGGVATVAASNDYPIWIHEILHLEPFHFDDEYAYGDGLTNRDIDDYCKKESKLTSPNIAFIADEKNEYSSDREARYLHQAQIPWYNYLLPTEPITKRVGQLLKLGSQSLEGLGLYRGGPCYTVNDRSDRRHSFIPSYRPTIMGNTGTSYLTEFHIDYIINTINGN